MNNKLYDIVYSMFTNKFSNPVDISDLWDILHIESLDEQNELGNILIDLEEDFIITHNKQGQFAPLSYFHLMKGELIVKDQGYGFVDSENFSVFINRDDLSSAISKDIVLVKYIDKGNNKYDGKVVRIIKRGISFVYGTLKKGKKDYYIDTFDSVIKKPIIVSFKDINKAKLYDVVKAKIKKYEIDYVSCEIEEILGNSDTPFIDIEMLIKASGIVVDFSKEAIYLASKLPNKVETNDIVNRVDYRNKMIITIDGDDAKDFDDAISVELLNNGNYLLGVYIADVSYYVNLNDALDLDARFRSNSTYLPTKVIPMLPFKLSNGICSLNEGVDRLVVSCIMEIDKSGNVVDSSIHEGVIKSFHRMTYTNVNKMLNNDEELLNKYSDIKELIINAYNLSKILHKKRVNDGAFMFETTSSKITLNGYGECINVEVLNRGISESIIEEFMLLANITVANTMRYLDVPFIYRIHEKPSDDKISKLLTMLKGFNKDYKIKSKKSISAIIKQIVKDFDTKEEGLQQDELTRRLIINDSLVRSMSKAKYQENNIGHFGLSVDCYTHFTSPIRRYPDLLVHRLIKRFLLNTNDLKSVEYYDNLVSSVSLISSNNERRSEKLERDVEDYKKCEYMKNYINFEYDCIITSVTVYGAYIRLSNTIEGLLRFANMPYYYEKIDDLTFVNNTLGIKYHVGYSYKVKVERVSMEERIVFFDLINKKK